MFFLSYSYAKNTHFTVKGGILCDCFAMSSVQMLTQV